MSGFGDTCEECGARTWKGRCGRSRCPINSERHLRRQGERVAANLAAYPGRCVMLTMTGPGGSEFDAWAWNGRMLLSWRRLNRAACQYANRHVKCQRSGVLVRVPELQRRGALHLHVVLGGESQLERRWCEAFGRYCRRNAVRYGFGAHARLDQKWTRPGEQLGGYVSKLARYVSKAGGLRTMYENGELPGHSFYVSRRLTSCTGITIRMLRRRSAAWATARLSVPVGKLRLWLEYEAALRRELTTRELAGLPGVRRRAVLLT